MRTMSAKLPPQPSGRKLEAEMPGRDLLSEALLPDALATSES